MNRSFRIVTGVAALILSFEFGQSQPRWEVMAGPNGGEFRAIFSYQDTLYAGSAFQRMVFKSTDAGTTWHRSVAPNLEPNENIVGEMGSIIADMKGLMYAGKNHAVLVGETLFVSSQGGLYRSTNRGKQWFYVNHTITTGDYTTADDSGSIFVASDQKIIILRGYGRTAPEVFYQGAYGSRIRSIQWNPDHSLSIAVDSSFKRSFDSGKNWTSVDLHAVVFHLLSSDQFGIVASTSNGVLHSNDGGEHWSSLGLAGFSVYGCAVDSKGGMYASTEVGVWKNAGGGSPDWKLLPVTLMPVNAFAQDSAGVLYAGTDKGLRYSYDHGTYWNTIEDNFFQVTAVTVDHKNSLFAGSLGIVKYALPISSASRFQLVCTNKIGFITYGTTELAVSKDNTLYAAIYHTVVLSKDDGVTWKVSGPMFTDIPFYAYGVSVAGDQTAYSAYGGYGVYRYDPQSDDWTARSNGITPKDVYAVLSDDDGRLYCGNFNGMWYSDNNGVSWHMKADDSLAGTFIQKIVKNKRGDIFAATGKGLFASKDRGESWHNLGTIAMDLGFSNSPFLSVFPLSNDTLLVGGLDGILYRCITDDHSSTVANNIHPDIDDFRLSQNYPNPFNPSTTIDFSVAFRSKIKIAIYTILGQEIVTLVNETKEAGTYTVLFNGSALSSGVYYYRLITPSVSITKRMSILK